MEVLANVRRASHVSDAALGDLAPLLKLKKVYKIKQTAARLKKAIFSSQHAVLVVSCPDYFGGREKYGLGTRLLEYGFSTGAG